MEHTAPPSPTSAAAPSHLNRAIYYQVTHTLRRLLPPPVTDTPQDLAQRDIAAIAHVAALRPADAEEANVAALCVATSLQALDSIHEARAHADNTTVMLQCLRQANAMMRQAKSWRLHLLNIQTARHMR